MFFCSAIDFKVLSGMIEVFNCLFNKFNAVKSVLALRTLTSSAVCAFKLSESKHKNPAVTNTVLGFRK